MAEIVKMIPYIKPECKKCGKEFDDSYWDGDMCPACCGRPYQCDVCGQWVEQVNKKGVCKDCIPRYIKYNSISELIPAMNYSGHGEIERIKGEIDAICRTLDRILATFPKGDRDDILTLEVDNWNSNPNCFTRDEDKIEENDKPEVKTDRWI